MAEGYDAEQKLLDEVRKPGVGMSQLEEQAKAAEEIIDSVPGDRLKPQEQRYKVRQEIDADLRKIVQSNYELVINGKPVVRTNGDLPHELYKQVEATRGETIKYVLKGWLKNGETQKQYAAQLLRKKTAGLGSERDYTATLEQGLRVEFDAVQATIKTLEAGRIEGYDERANLLRDYNSLGQYIHTWVELKPQLQAEYSQLKQEYFSASRQSGQEKKVDALQRKMRGLEDRMRDHSHRFRTAGAQSETFMRNVIQVQDELKRIDVDLDQAHEYRSQLEIESINLRGQQRRSRIGGRVPVAVHYARVESMIKASREYRLKAEKREQVGQQILDDVRQKAKLPQEQDGSLDYLAPKGRVGKSVPERDKEIFERFTEVDKVLKDNVEDFNRNIGLTAEDS
ncbi:MAG: hypothetical protein ABIH41_01585 [Nanoarchaeota archaeon]